MLYFYSIFFSVFVSNQQKLLSKMATFTFRVGDHIFLLCYLKNHMTWFCDFWSKIFGNILKIFLISCSKIFKLIFWNHQLKILRMRPFTLNITLTLAKFLSRLDHRIQFISFISWKKNISYDVPNFF
jgi:hypothetical protein